MVKPEKIIRALAGSYSMVNNTSWRNGIEDPNPLGLGAFGIITYTPWGYMSANMAARDPTMRPTNINWAPKANDSDADWALVGKHALSYAGPFRLNESVPATETEGQLLHGPIEVASVPTMEGLTFVRNYTVVKVKNDGTYFRVAARSASGEFYAEIWWKKIPGASLSGQ
ncbi:hypothetical protein OQA88_4377 [Cercophora sp. LCS_1]